MTWKQTEKKIYLSTVIVDETTITGQLLLGAGSRNFVLSNTAVSEVCPTKRKCYNVENATKGA